MNKNELMNKREVDNNVNESLQVYKDLFDKIDLGIVDLELVEIPAVVDKLEGLVAFANPITFTPSITSITMSFNLGEGMSLNQAGTDIINIGSGPFQAIFTTN